MMPFQRLHPISNRATPNKFMLYKHSLLLRSFNIGNGNSIERIITSRQKKFVIGKEIMLKIVIMGHYINQK